MTDIRQIALTLLDEYEASDKYLNLSLASHRLDRLSTEARASLTALLYTAVERKLTYDYYIGAISGRAPDGLDMHTRNILRRCMRGNRTRNQLFHAVSDKVTHLLLRACGIAAGDKRCINGIRKISKRVKHRAVKIKYSQTVFHINNPY